MKPTMLKKLLTCCILLLCLCIALPSLVVSATEPECPYTFEVNEETGAVTVHGTGIYDSASFTDDQWMYIWCAREIRLSEGFTAIAEGAFSHHHINALFPMATKLSGRTTLFM